MSEPGDVCWVMAVKYRLMTSALVFFLNSTPSLLTPVVVCLASCQCLSPWTLARFVWPHLTVPSQCVTPTLQFVCVRALLLQSYPTLCDPMDWGPPGSSVCGILQARVLEWNLVGGN